MRVMIRRGAAAALALWFLAGGVGDALGAHHCPHHDGIPLSTRADGPGHPEQAVPHAGPGAHDHGGAPHGSHGPCTCVGRCQAGAAPSFGLPSAPQGAPLAAVPQPSEAAPDAPSRPAILPYALPWGNAPPVL